MTDEGDQTAAMSRPRQLRSRSLVWQIVVIVAVLLAVTTAIVGVVTVVAFQGYLTQRLDKELMSASQRSLSSQGDLPSPSPDGANPPPTGSDTSNRFIGAPGQSADTVVAVIKSQSFVLAGYTDSKGNQHRLGAEVKTVLSAVPRDAHPVTRSLGALGEYRVVATKSRGAVFITGLPTGGIRSAIENLVAVIAGLAAAGMVVSAVFGTLLVRRALGPLARVAATAAAVAEIDLRSNTSSIQPRVLRRDIEASREVGQVGETLNRLLGHVSAALTARDRAEKSIRDFVADVAHELRTPLATIRAYAELTRRERSLGAIQGNVERIEIEAVRMGDLVEELLLLASLEAASSAPGTEPLRTEVDFTSMVVDATMDARAAGAGHRWRLDVDDDPVVVSGDPAQLRRVLVNLLTNARVHTPKNTRITVSLHRETGPAPAFESAVFSVSNDGPPIPEDARPYLFERFTRGDLSRSRDTGSTGLGLAIVQAVVEAHGGSVRVSSVPAATVFTVRLPLRNDNGRAATMS